MYRPIRKVIPFKKSIIWLFFCSIVFIFSTNVFATERHYGSRPSSFGFTDDQFENKVKEYLDVPYKPGGSSKRGMDCSGFSRIVYSKLFGIELPHSSVDQFRSSALQKINVKKLQPGDLIFFSNQKKKRINHVGVYISDRQFIHASTSKGVTISSLDDSYWKNRLVGSKRHVALKLAFAAPKNDIIKIKSSLKKHIH